MGLDAHASQSIQRSTDCIMTQIETLRLQVREHLKTVDSQRSDEFGTDWGNKRPSEMEQFARLSMVESLLREIPLRVYPDTGSEPVEKEED